MKPVLCWHVFWGCRLWVSRDQDLLSVLVDTSQVCLGVGRLTLFLPCSLGSVGSLDPWVPVDDLVPRSEHALWLDPGDCSFRNHQQMSYETSGTTEGPSGDSFGSPWTPAPWLVTRGVRCGPRLHPRSDPAHGNLSLEVCVLRHWELFHLRCS